MRQAGRSLPEYRELRVGTDMLDACLTPELASEITLQPVRRHGVDAAHLLQRHRHPGEARRASTCGSSPGAGRCSRTRCGRRPMSATCRRSTPRRSTRSARRSRATVAELGETPLIGFAGAPYTLASYLVEGGPSKEQLRTRALMHSDPDAVGGAARLVRRGHRRVPRRADRGGRVGRAALRLVGGLAEPRRLHRSASRRTRRAALAPARALGVPLVHFGVGTGELLAAMHDVGVDVMGVDWRIPLDEASRRLGGNVPLQGNIDPALLAAPWPVLEAHVRDVLERGAQRAGARAEPRPRRAARHRPGRAHPHRGVRPARGADVRALDPAACTTAEILADTPRERRRTGRVTFGSAVRALGHRRRPDAARENSRRARQRARMEP